VIEKTVRADVLVVGGGIAGLMAAIRARELGARVVLAEKAIRCGAGLRARAAITSGLTFPSFTGRTSSLWLRKCGIPR